MAASAGAWYRVGKVNVVGGSQSIVGVGTNWQSDVIAIAIGDAFTLDAKTWYEVIAVNSDTSITLDRGFEGGTGTDKSYAILRNTSGTILTRIAGQVSVQFNQKQLFLDELRTWLNSDNETEELTDSHGLKQSLKTPSQMVRDHDNKLAELDAINPYPWAMRKVEFEAHRAANNEKFAASGFVHFGKSYNNAVIEDINEGLYVYNSVFSDENSIYLGAGGDNIRGVSKENSAHIVIAGVMTDVTKLSRNNTILNSRINLPPAENGTRTYDSATGASVTHATPAIAFASETDTNKVVTDRVDMWGFEAFLREINDADPFVYKNGLIQSQATNIDGVTTITDNVRPDTYFAWYEGDGSSTGKGVNWQTATEAQRTAIASNPDNNIYFDDATGKFYQWCVRGRSFAGAGNGDWNFLDSNGTLGLGNALNFDYSPIRKLVYAIGDEDNDGAYTSSLGFSFQSLAYLDFNNNSNSGRGIFSTADNKVHFLVCGTVNRLNKGAYHPSYNPLGASMFENSAGSARDWSNTTPKPTNKLECFSLVSVSSTGFPNTGSIESKLSGRHDNRLYDAIYASGQGGVCRDMRYPAWELTQEDFAEADLKVKSGYGRGEEKTTLCKVVDTGYWLTSDHNNKDNKWLISGSTCYLYMGEQLLQSDFKETLGSIIVIDKGNDLIFKMQPHSGIGASYTGGTLRCLTSELETLKGTLVTSGASSAEVYLVCEYDAKYSVSGGYTHTEVMGDPADILQCGDINGGWIGSWNPNIPDGSGARFTITRKVASSSNDICLYSKDQGDSWLSTTSAFNLIESGNSVAHPSVFDAGSIVIYQFKARAKCTINCENKDVYGGYYGIKNIIASSDAYALGRGTLLKESLIGKVRGVSSYANGGVQSLPVNTATMDRAKLIGATREAYGPTHDPIVIDGDVDVDGFKALNYNVVENQQGFVQYAYTELIHNGTDWGDDGKIHIVDGQSIRLDDNGNTVLYGTARTVEPLGWVKNDK